MINYYGSRYLNSMLKLWYERPRPDVSQLVTATGYSFPSGHTMNATAFLGFIAYVTITEHRIALHKKVLIIFTACFVIFSISVSRIYLGVHYPSDILAGWAAGELACFMYYFSSSILKKRTYNIEDAKEVITLKDNMHFYRNIEDSKESIIYIQ